MNWTTDPNDLNLLTDIAVQGGANAEEVAAVLAVLSRYVSATGQTRLVSPDGLADWRATRRAALAYPAGARARRGLR